MGKNNKNRLPLVVITGASSGIGAACAKKFARNGYPVLLLARRLNRLELVAKSLAPAKVIVARVDVTDQFKFKAAVAAAEKEYGPTDLIINNAGLLTPGELKDQNWDNWKPMIDINIGGVLNGISIVINSMVQRQHGTIINISSVAGRWAYPNIGVYCGTKYFVNALSESLRKEVANDNVRVISIQPGYVETELAQNITKDAKHTKWVEQIKKERVSPVSADNVAETVYFAYNQHQSVSLKEIVITPTKQVV